MERACVARCIRGILCVWVVRFLIVIAFHYMTGCPKVDSGQTAHTYHARKQKVCRLKSED